MKTKGTSFPKTVFYVRAFTDCSNIYFFLNPSCTDTSLTLRDIPIMLTIIYSGHVHYSSHKQQKKEEVLKLFSQKDGKARMILAIAGFSMGADCPDVQRDRMVLSRW